MPESEQRFLVKWTETVTHLDAVYVDEADVRRVLRYTPERWDELGEDGRRAMIRFYLDSHDGIDKTVGTRRMHTVGRTGFDVVDSTPWPQDTPEPQL